MSPHALPLASRWLTRRCCIHVPTGIPQVLLDGDERQAATQYILEASNPRDCYHLQGVHGKQQGATAGSPLHPCTGLAGGWALSLPHSAAEEKTHDAPHDQYVQEVHQQVQAVKEMRIEWGTASGLRAHPSGHRSRQSPQYVCEGNIEIHIRCKPEAEDMVNREGVES